jgi:hypothetical protein
VKLLFAGLRMDIENGQAALPRALGHTLKNRFSGAGNLQKIPIFGGGADEDQVGVLRVVKRKKAAAFYADIAVKKAEDLRHTLCLLLMEGADIYEIAKNCRTSVEMIEKYYAAHLKTNLDAHRDQRHAGKAEKNKQKPAKTTKPATTITPESDV